MKKSKLKKGVFLLEHQTEAIKFMVSRKEALCSLACGTGKTLISISSGFYLLAKGYIKKYIIIGTKSSLLEIVNDFKKLTEYGAPYIVINDEELDYFIKSNEQIAVIQYENLLKINIQNMKELLSTCDVGVSLDEIQKIKTPKATITQVLTILRPLFKHCYGFTATSITSNIYDLYNIIKFLNKRLLSTKKSFNDNYVNLKENVLRNGRRYYEIISLKNLEDLAEKLDKIMIRYYPKQEINFQLVTTDMKDFTEYTQVANGVLEETEKTPASRLPALCEVVNRRPEKLNLYLDTIANMMDNGVITYCAFHKSKELIMEALEKRGIDCREISGKSSTEDRKKVKKWFVDNPKNKVLIITNAGGQSLNLQCTNKLVFYDIPFSVGSFIQIIGRIVRLFSDFKEFDIYFIIINNTIDEYKYQYVSMSKDMIVKLLRNEFIPESDNTSLNTFILKKLRKKLLWRN